MRKKWKDSGVSEDVARVVNKSATDLYHPLTYTEYMKVLF